RSGEVGGVSDPIAESEIEVLDNGTELTVLERGSEASKLSNWCACSWPVLTDVAEMTRIFAGLKRALLPVTLVMMLVLISSFGLTSLVPLVKMIRFRLEVACSIIGLMSGSHLMMTAGAV